MPDNYAYLGTRDPTSGTAQANLIAYIAEQVMARMSTATVVKIVRAPYDASGNTIEPGTIGPVGYVDVQPLVNQLDGYGNATPHGTVYRLSYHRHQGGGNATICDPVIGDIGKMICADRDTSSVRATNGQANPGSRRKFDKADGTYFGCTQASTPTQGRAFTSTGITDFDKNGNTVVFGDTGVTINGVLITLAGDVINKAGVVLGTHVHTMVVTGDADSGPPLT